MCYLREERRASLEELAEHVAALERDRPREDVADAHRERVRIALHHAHLPKLDTTAVVDYDPRSRTAVYGDPPEQWDALVRQCEAAETDLG